MTPFFFFSMQPIYMLLYFEYISSDFELSWVQNMQRRVKSIC